MAATTERRCPAIVFGDGQWRGYPCGRPIKNNNTLCGLHAANKRRREANAAAWQARWDADRERAAFVVGWRERFPELVFCAPWVCPLCGEAVQTAGGTVNGQQRRIDGHQAWHGDDWTAYAAIGGTPS